MRRPIFVARRAILPAVSWAMLASFALAAGQYGKVELVRDRWGVPHVFAETDAGAMYGLGCATAEDRGFQMYYSLRIMQGRLAEVIGDVKKVRRNETALENDRKMRTFGFYRAAKQLVGQLDKESVGLLEAYSDGVNDYFERNSEGLPEVFQKVGLVPEPWTPADCLVSWWHLAQFFATDGTRDLIYYRNLTEGQPSGRRRPPTRGGRGGGRAPQGRGGRAQPPRGARELTPLPPDESTSVVGRHDVSDAWIQQAVAFLEEHGYSVQKPAAQEQGGASGPKFSHAWVADGRRTGTGSAVLVSMPQTPVANPSLFYEFHVKGKTFDARGAGVPGSPVILIGWNRHVAWGMTALGADQADLFRLKTDADHPDQYEFDGQWRKMELTGEEIRVKGRQPESILIRQTRFGPVVNEFAFARPGDPPVALKRIPVCETDRETIQGALAMMRAEDVHEFFKALAGWRFPTANVVFGDSEGNIGYSTTGALPLRSPLALDLGQAAHDGSDSRYDWQAIVPQELAPHVINPAQGYLFSGNHRPIGSFYPIAIGIRTGSAGDTLRSWRLRELLCSTEALTPQRLLEMHNDPVNAARREIARIGFHLRDVLKRDLSAEAEKALGHIEDWYAAGAPSRLDVPGAELAMQFNTFFRAMATDLALIYGGGESGLSYFLKTVGRRLDQNAKAEIKPLEQEFVDRALADAWASAERKYGPEPGRWAARARRQVTERKLGYYVSLDGFPSLDESYDLSVPPLACVDGGTVQSQGAQAYVQWVPLADVDRARSILPPGVSERPDSPWRTVNVRAWVEGKLRPAPLSRAAVERVARSTVVLCP